MLYQYINFDNPEFNIITAAESDKEQSIQENVSESKAKVPIPNHQTARPTGNSTFTNALFNLFNFMYSDLKKKMFSLSSTSKS